MTLTMSWLPWVHQTCSTLQPKLSASSLPCSKRSAVCSAACAPCVVQSTSKTYLGIPPPPSASRRPYCQPAVAAAAADPSGGAPIPLAARTLQCRLRQRGTAATSSDVAASRSASSTIGHGCQTRRLRRRSLSSAPGALGESAVTGVVKDRRRLEALDDQVNGGDGTGIPAPKCRRMRTVPARRVRPAKNETAWNRPPRFSKGARRPCTRQEARARYWGRWPTSGLVLVHYRSAMSF
jgi:hypothetical protein